MFQSIICASRHLSSFRIAVHHFLAGMSRPVYLAWLSRRDIAFGGRPLMAKEMRKEIQVAREDARKKVICYLR